MLRYKKAMWPTIVTFGEGNVVFPVHTWGLMVTLAFLAAAGVVHRRAPSAGLDAEKLVGLYLVAFVGGLAGARLLHFTMAETDRFFSDPWIYLRFWEGGFAFYGGVIFATLCGVLYARWRGLDVWRLADVVAPAIMLGLAIGRVGCFFAGCCHGRACPLPAGALNILPQDFSGGALYLFGSAPFVLVENHHGVGLNDTPMYPTTMWSSAVALLLFLLLSWRWRHRRFDGQVFAWLLLIYPLTRSTVELFRGDVVRGVEWFGLFSTSQLLSIPIFALGVAAILLRRSRGVLRVEAPAADDDEELLAELAAEP